MIKALDLQLSPEVAYDDVALEKHLVSLLKINPGQEFSIRKIRRSVDARSHIIKINLSVEVFVNEVPAERVTYKPDFPTVSHQKQVIIVGAGPAGMFAALKAVEMGFKPILLERGKDVRTRRRDLAAINKDQIVNPESNYCFGEGGAGTYSDGKLYTRSSKRGDIKRILEIFVSHGAHEEILVDAHPHIGTNKLPGIVAAIRETILKHGGEVLFNTKVTDFVFQNGEMKGVITEDGKEHTGIGVVLATGHSARDIFELCHAKGVLIEAKPFALGVRVEHQQDLIDSIQYKCDDRGPYLPASSYSLVEQTMVKGVQRGVFSFCMCPGGFIVPSATAQEEIVVNGMSPSKRDSVYSNSGIVVSVELEDIRQYAHLGPLAAMQFQKDVEHKAWLMGGKTQVAPAQLLTDFVNNKVSAKLLDTSYQPGLSSVNMLDVLPRDIGARLQQGFVGFGKKMRGYYTDNAQIIGVESRTSSPVRIPRDKESCEHVKVKRLYPCGEGAGYAGGIVSAAMDGERCVTNLIGMYGN